MPHQVSKSENLYVMIFLKFSIPKIVIMTLHIN